MSSVLRRTIYFDSSHDEVRFFDFALVQTTLGTMVEPVSASKLPTYGAQFDPTNELTKIDAMEPLKTSGFILGDDEEAAFVSQEDIDAALNQWKDQAPEKFKDLLEAQDVEPS